MKTKIERCTPSPLRKAKVSEKREVRRMESSVGKEIENLYVKWCGLHLWEETETYSCLLDVLASIMGQLVHTWEAATSKAHRKIIKIRLRKSVGALCCPFTGNLLLTRNNRKVSNRKCSIYLDVRWQEHQEQALFLETERCGFTHARAHTQKLLRL